MIKFAGQFLPNYVRINGIKYSILAPIEHKTATIQGRTGAYDFGIENGMKEIEVDYQIIGTNPNDIIIKAREFATWLHYDELQTLVILDEPDKYYMARVVGDTVVTETHRVGEGTIKFVVPSGYAESISEKVFTFTPTTSNPYFTVTNNGTADTYPIIELDMTKDVENIAVVADDAYVQIGDTDDVDKVAVPAKSLKFREDFASLSGWSTAPSIEDGTIQGTLVATGDSYKQSGGNYGTGSRWHGASMFKAFSSEIQDFELQTRFVWNMDQQDEVGRIEFTLLDVNNIAVGKISMTDPSSTKRSGYFAARAGTADNGKVFVKDDGVIYRRTVFKRDRVWAWDIDTADLGWGYMSLKRVGKDWTFYIADLAEKAGVNKHFHPQTFKWRDSRNLYSTKKIAKIQVGIATFGTNKPVKDMQLTDLKVYEINKTAVTDKIKDLDDKDNLTIDNASAGVFKNGKPYFTGLDPSSTFFSLSPGVNQLALSPPAAKVKVRYRERFK